VHREAKEPVVFSGAPAFAKELWFLVLVDSELEALFVLKLHPRFVQTSVCVLSEKKKKGRGGVDATTLGHR
jgi:hypothetical protein